MIKPPSHLWISTGWFPLVHFGSVSHILERKSNGWKRSRLKMPWGEGDFKSTRPMASPIGISATRSYTQQCKWCFERKQIHTLRSGTFTIFYLSSRLTFVSREAKNLTYIQLIFVTWKIRDVPQFVSVLLDSRHMFKTQWQNARLI